MKIVVFIEKKMLLILFCHDFYKKSRQNLVIFSLSIPGVYTPGYKHFEAVSKVLLEIILVKSKLLNY